MHQRPTSTQLSTQGAGRYLTGSASIRPSGQSGPTGMSSNVRLCCKVCSGPWMAPAGDRSGSNVEQLGNEGGLGPHVASANPPYLPLPHHRHHLVARQCSSRRPEATEAEPRSDQAFHAPVVLLHNVIEILDLTQPRASPQLAVIFHLLDGARIGRVLVHRDGARVHRVRLPQSLAEEPLRGCRVPLGREQKVNRL